MLKFKVFIQTILLTLILSDLFNVFIDINYELSSNIAKFTFNKTYLLIPIALLSFIIIFTLIIIFNLIYLKLFPKVNTNNKYPYRKVYHMVSFFASVLRIKVKVKGRENVPKDEVFVIYSNHQSQFDIIGFLIAMKGQRHGFISKPGIFNWFFVGKWMKKMNCIPMNNKSDKEAAKSIIKGIKNVKNNLPMIIFPEGVRSKSKELGEFKSGAFQLAKKPKATILPVTINDSYIAESKFKNPFAKKTFTMEFHKPIKYEEYSELSTKEVADKVKEVIKGAIN